MTSNEVRMKGQVISAAKFILWVCNLNFAHQIIAWHASSRGLSKGKDIQRRTFFYTL